MVVVNYFADIMGYVEMAGARRDSDWIACHKAANGRKWWATLVEDYGWTSGGWMTRLLIVFSRPVVTVEELFFHSENKLFSRYSNAPTND